MAETKWDKKQGKVEKKKNNNNKVGSAIEIKNIYGKKTKQRGERRKS